MQCATRGRPRRQAAVENGDVGVSKSTEHKPDACRHERVTNVVQYNRIVLAQAEALAVGVKHLLARHLVRQRDRVVAALVDAEEERAGNSTLAVLLVHQKQLI